MKPTLTISLFLGLAATALGQTPKVVQKPTAAPATVKVVAVPAKASGAVVKPAPAKPATVKAATVKPAVIAVQPAAKPVVVQAQKNTPVVAKTAVKPVAMPAQKNTPVVAKPVIAAAPAKPQAATPVKAVAAAKPVVAEHKAQPAVRAVAAAPALTTAKDPFTKDKGKNAQASVKAVAVAAKPAATAKVATGTTVAVNEAKAATEVKQPEVKKVSATNRRDPFVSPVVQIGAAGSGCSTGKRCLAIDQVALKGVVRSENGMIAVVVNAMDKAYFLRENDPVFNGYVTKITQDSIVFKETFRDRLGKEMTRDVTKTISRPAA